MKNKKAEAGIGTLILFIALILVAAVAAGVLIQTSSSLQSKALVTGSQAKGQVSTRLLILSAWGEDVDGNQSIEDMYFKAKLAPGSDPISLHDSYVAYDSTDQRRTYRFNQSGECNLGNLTDPDNSASFLVTGRVAYNTPGYLLSGDIVDVCFRLPQEVGESTELSVAFSPKIGTQTVFTTITPDVITDTKVILYS